VGLATAAIDAAGRVCARLRACGAGCGGEPHGAGATGAGLPKLAEHLPTDIVTKFGALDGELLAVADRIIISPGIDPYLPVFDGARAKKIAIVSDIQLFHEVAKQRHIPIIAITGSNAKSTVTTLVGEMVKNAGFKVGVGGLYGGLRGVLFERLQRFRGIFKSNF
jgi:hypothetical protein